MGKKTMKRTEEIIEERSKMSASDKTESDAAQPLTTTKKHRHEFTCEECCGMETAYSCRNTHCSNHKNFAGKRSKRRGNGSSYHKPVQVEADASKDKPIMNANTSSEDVSPANQEVEQQLYTYRPKSGRYNKDSKY